LVSLLPAPLHPVVAELCITAHSHLVTASYVSAEMDALNSRWAAKGCLYFAGAVDVTFAWAACRAVEAGVSFLCELGLDPGIDHMGAMSLIDIARKEKKDVGVGDSLNPLRITLF
jgi:alpha-aminoadipic semialdehyde synthase